MGSLMDPRVINNIEAYQNSTADGGGGGLSQDDKIYMGYYFTGLVTICVICFIGNGLVVHAILYYDYLRQVHNWFVLSLAVSDMIQGVTMPVYTLGHSSKLTIMQGLGEFVCACLCVFVVIVANVATYLCRFVCSSSVIIVHLITYGSIC